MGEKGEVVVDLMQVSKHKDTAKGMIMRGIVTDASLTGAMANVDTYVNLASSSHPDGELRGQIKLKGDNTTSSENATSSM